MEYLLNQVDACYLRSTVFPAQSADAASTKRVLVAIVQLCYDTQDWEALNENIMILTKRRGQLKMAIQAMVEQCSKFIDETPDRDTKLKLVNTLRTATEGKVSHSGCKIAAGGLPIMAFTASIFIDICTYVCMHIAYIHMYVCTYIYV